MGTKGSARCTMTEFLLGLMVGIIIGRAFELWVNWKYKK
jgi:hypothetical protein